jgi:DNA-binding NtrC family response regulator
MRQRRSDLHVESFVKRICVVIHPLGASEEALAAVRDSLSALSDELELRVAKGTLAPALAPEVALWLVDAHSWPDACAALGEWRTLQPGTTHLVLASEVPPQGIEQLMGQGAFDFIRQPASNDETGLRLKRALSALPTPTVPRDEAPPLPASVLNPPEPAPALWDESFQAAKARVVEDFERHYIERLLQASEGNISHAARIAKKNRRAFFELIRKHDIDAGRFRMGLACELS